MNQRTHRSGHFVLAAALALVCAAVARWDLAHAQAVPSTGPVRTVVVLDPAHGGPETGARLSGQAVEKDVNLALASKVRQALVAAGFSVISTRDGDPATVITTDQRAEIANRQHALACLVLHATQAGSGVHLYASPLEPSPEVTYDPDVRPAFQPIPWDEAQADSVRQSLRLQEHLNAAVSGAKLSVLRGRASVPPLDNLTCPAMAVELAPLGAPGGDQTLASDAGYQQRVADAVVAAMRSWRDDPASHPGAPTLPPRPVAPVGAMH